MKFKNSEEVIHLIEKRRRNGIELRNFKQFMEDMGNPQDCLKSIHVAGTNGKGSTVNDLRSILQEAGYRVGSFTSPYLETHHDRIRINDEYIPEAYIVKYANTYFDKWEDNELSMFEIDMFLAVMYFVEMNVDYAIFEVGLGGRKDATNIIKPMVSLITNIGKDHMEYLGNTYTSIAKEKGGIIKDNTTLITTERKQECIAVFQELCLQHNASYIQVEEATNIFVDDSLHFTYKGVEYKQQMLAKYQVANATLAIEAISYLNRKDFIKVSDKQLQIGLYNAIWKGRFEIVQKEPLVILDGAHNEEGIKALVESLKEYDNIHILFSALKDKSYDTMLDLLSSVSNHIYVCEFPFYRVQDAEVIGKHHDVHVIRDYKVALQTLLDKHVPIVVCGSLYFISIIREYFMKGESTL